MRGNDAANCGSCCGWRDTPDSGIHTPCHYREVWLGCWLGSTVAVKSMLPSLQHQEKLVKRFIAEIHMQSKLHHPNVTMFMAACTKKPHLCLVLEYCVCGSMRARWHELHCYA